MKDKSLMRQKAYVRIILTFFFCSIGSAQGSTVGLPNQINMSNDCSEVSGIYDEAKPDHPGAAPAGLWAFGFPLSELKTNDNTVKLRQLSIHFGADRTLHIDYLIDGSLVSSRTFTSSGYVCENGKLRFVVYKRTGDQIFDMLSNEGTITNTSVMFRVNDYLNVKTTSDAKATFYHFIPHTSHSESVLSFPVH